MTQGRLPEELALIPLLRGISSDDLRWLMDHTGVRYLRRGSVLLSPEQVNDTAYIVLSGRLEVRLASCGEVAHAYLEAGNCVGEMSVIEGTVPSATVVADADCQLISIPGAVLWSLIDRSHAVARNLLHALSARVRRDNEVIAETLRQQRLFAESAQTDFLTGLRNRRWLDDMLPRLLERCRLGHQPLSLIMLDLDHFKAYNDTHGHLAGDRALRAVAHAVRDHLRPGDAAARYGGEEFVVIMPDTQPKDAKVIAERLCDVIRKGQVTDSDGTLLPSVTVSIGLASLKGDEGAEQLVAAADAAMYRAKEAGRNRVAV